MPFARIHSNFIFILFAVLITVATPSLAANPFDVVAVVEGEAITVHDVEARTNLILFTSGLPNTAETRAKMRNQIFNSLVDEALQRQEAKSEDVTVTEADIDRSVENIASQNKMTREEFEKKLKDNKIELSSMRSQLESRSLWTKVAKKKFSPLIKVSEAEIDDELATLKTKSTEDNYLLAEIFLPVDSPEEEDAAKQLSMKLLNDMRAGAPFSTLARQYSKSATAQSGGDMGWVATTQLSNALVTVISQITTGQVSPPIKTDEGYYLIMIRDKRKPASQMGGGDSMELYQMIFSAADPTKPEQMQTQLAFAEKARAQIKSCADAAIFAGANTVISHGNIGFVTLSELPPQIESALQNANINDTVGPVALNNRSALFTVCDKKVLEAQLPTRDQVSNKLKQEFISRRAQQYLLELRRSAIIDIKNKNQQQ